MTTPRPALTAAQKTQCIRALLAVLCDLMLALCDAAGMPATLHRAISSYFAALNAQCAAILANRPAETPNRATTPPYPVTTRRPSRTKPRGRTRPNPPISLIPRRGHPTVSAARPWPSPVVHRTKLHPKPHTFCTPKSLRFHNESATPIDHVSPRQAGTARQFAHYDRVKHS
ncbi:MULTISPECIES: hypothetical protein [Acidiphilium]|uniref:hypothetical protein n=1 Tax=Acidiphilium TaxID=522 RepID=UPI00257A155C|nr:MULTISPECIES: hypothetical protein [Acidiphilium]